MPYQLPEVDVRILTARVFLPADTKLFGPVPVAVRSKAWGLQPLGLLGSLRAWIFGDCVCCVGSGLYDGLITCTEEPY